MEDPGQANLSRFDIEMLEYVAEEHRLRDEWDLVEFTHAFPEWIKNDPGNSQMKWIPLSDIYEAVGRTYDQEIEEEAKEERAFSLLFGNCLNG